MSSSKKRSSRNRFAHTVDAGIVGVGEAGGSLASVRSFQRSENDHMRSGSVELSNPTASADIDREDCQDYESKVYGLGLAPNIPSHFWQLLRGDAGAGSSIYRVTELYQLLAPEGILAARTPYSKAIEIATMRSTDHRPRYFHVSLFSVGRVTRVRDPAGVVPMSTSEVKRFAAGIPAGTPSVAGNTQFGIPQFGTSKFRIMISDESGQRFVDADAIGSKSLSIYAFGVTVFALIKDDGYEIDRAAGSLRPLGPGIVDQSVVGARIIPIMSNDTSNIVKRTVTIISPGGGTAPTAVPIPPGALRVQGYAEGIGVGVQSISFATDDPLNTASLSEGGQGRIIFIPTSPSPGAITDIYDISNANVITISNPLEAAPRSWTFVFEVSV